MLHKTLLAAMGGALALFAAPAAFAQDGGERTQSEEASGTMTGERVLPGRIGDRSSRRQQRQQQEAAEQAAQPTPEQIKASAQAVLGQTSAQCQVTEAASLGVTAEQQAGFEVACASGPGYLLIASTPPKAFDCVELSGQAVTARERDPNADVGQQCTLPANQDVVRVINAYAQEAGVTCTVDQAAAIAKSTEGNVIYEVGCANADGWWIEKAGGAWKTTPCWDLALSNQTCRYTTADEGKAGWTAALANTPASACVVDQARRVGRDAQGLTVYEVKCGGGEGYFARLNDAWATQRVQTCAEAANVAGGCTLTTAAATPPAPAASPAPSGGRA